MGEHPVQLIETLELSHLIGRIIAGRAPKLGEYVRDVDRYGFARTPHRVLVDHMAGDGEEIGLRAADALAALDAQQA